MQPFLCRALSLGSLALLGAACQHAPARAEPAPVGPTSAVEPQPARPVRQALNGGSGDPAGAAASGQCVTLVAQDPCGWSWSFRRNASGAGLQENAPVNLNAEIGFDAYQPDSFTVAISGGQRGAIVDLGSADELAERFHFGEFMGGGRGFSSIRFVNGRLMVCAQDPNNPVQPLTGPDSQLHDLRGNTNAAVHEGHIYLVHLEDSEKPAPLTAKLFVTAHEPRKSVSFRWLPVEEADKATREASAARSAVKSDDAGALATLYASDPLDYTLDLYTGRPGHMIQDGEVRNHDSHICLGYFPDCLTVAIQGGDKGAIEDLGSAQDLAAKGTFTLVGNGGNVFVAIDLPFLRGRAGLEQLASVAHAPAKAGHIYLVRIASEGKPDLYAKLLVLEFRPGESVTFRWQRLGE